MSSPNGLHVSALTVLLAACQGAPTPPVVPDPVAGANQMASGQAADTNTLPAPVPVLELRGTAALAVLGTSLAPLSTIEETAVETKASFRVELPFSVADARLSLLDSGDAMVPSSGSREVGGATVLTLTPAAPLIPGARFKLRLDGAATRELHAADGRRFAPLEWPVVGAGEPEAKKPSGRKGKRR